MSSRLSIEIALERGYVRMGDVRVDAVLDGQGVVRTATGAHVRPVTFAERGSVMAEAVAEDDPVTAVVEGLSRRSVVEPASEDPGILAALAVALAGGGEERLSLDEAARQASERRGWSWDRVLDTPAWLVDRAASEVSADAADGGWSTVVFEGPHTDDVHALSRRMAKNLLRRLTDRAPDRLASEARSGSKAGDVEASSLVRRMQGPRTTRWARASTGSDADSLAVARWPSASESPRAAAPSSHESSRSTPASPHESAASEWPTQQEAPTSPITSTRGSADLTARDGSVSFATAPAAVASPIAALAPPTTVNVQLSSWPDVARPAATGRAATTTTGDPWPPVFESRLAAPSAAPVSLSAPRERAVQNIEFTAAWIDELADALAAECDFRGLDR